MLRGLIVCKLLLSFFSLLWRMMHSTDACRMSVIIITHLSAIYISLQLLCCTITSTSGQQSISETRASIRTPLGYGRPLQGHVSYEREQSSGSKWNCSDGRQLEAIRTYRDHAVGQSQNGFQCKTGKSWRMDCKLHGARSWKDAQSVSTQSNLSANQNGYKYVTEWLSDPFQVSFLFYMVLLTILCNCCLLQFNFIKFYMKHFGLKKNESVRVPGCLGWMSSQLQCTQMYSTYAIGSNIE